MHVRHLAFLIAVCGPLLATQPAGARTDPPPARKGDPAPYRVLSLDGKTVHNVGQLQLHVGNWGMFGSLPGSGNSFSHAPSAQWPAGSGVEYLYDAGLWVGAIRHGVPSVSTAHAYEFEFRPTQDPADTMHVTAEGAGGGARLPSPLADDDSDGRTDEDWLNNRDDDGDGLIDEDFAAVSKNMLACWYTDDQPISLQAYPEHNPLHVLVRQESYQWEEDRFDDFVGINFWITNIGAATLEDVYIGFFCDADAGRRGSGTYWDDDATDFFRRDIRCTDLGPVSIDVAYTYDADGDNGETLGYFGVMFLGHTVDPTGEFAPRRVGIATYANFSGQTTFENGGDPTNDFERYELLSTHRIERAANEPRDYRMLVSAGPFKELRPGSTLVFQTAFVCGKGLAGMEENAASAQLTFGGSWFDLDEDPATGIGGRETPVFGPLDAVVVDSCLPGLQVPIPWASRDPLWINDDCAAERFAQLACGYSYADSLKFRTGVAARESRINWIIGTAPPPPHMRINDVARDGVEVYWDDYSEIIPDVKTLELDFEGYQLWRADGWDRPLGTTAQTGPREELWQMLLSADVINNLGEDTGLDAFRYEPLVPHILSSAARSDMVEAAREHLVEFPRDPPPCPQGVTQSVCDTIHALASAELGIPDGRRYYRYVDRAVHRGVPTFYSVTAYDHWWSDEGGVSRLRRGKAGSPASNIAYVEPRTPSQPAFAFDPDRVYVVPNPATRASLDAWRLHANNDDPSGVKVEFRNLPAALGSIRVYTLAGDLVERIPFDGRKGVGTARWDLISRNGQDVTSGVYLFSVETEGHRFPRVIGKFVIIR